LRVVMQALGEATAVHPLPGFFGGTARLLRCQAVGLFFWMQN
jgi:hypothetical protein